MLEDAIRRMLVEKLDWLNLPQIPPVATLPAAAPGVHLQSAPGIVLQGPNRGRRDPDEKVKAASWGEEAVVAPTEAGTSLPSPSFLACPCKPPA
jgi:hypothetical protein